MNKDIKVKMSFNWHKMPFVEKLARFVLWNETLTALTVGKKLYKLGSSGGGEEEITQ